MRYGIITRYKPGITPLRPVNRLRLKRLCLYYAEVPRIPVAASGGAQTLLSDVFAFRFLLSSNHSLFDDKEIPCWGADFAGFKSIQEAMATTSCVKNKQK